VTAPPPHAADGVRLRTVFDTWWPLAASWLLMACELPAVSAIMARLPQPTVSLAAYGGVVFPLALLIESPIIMLLAASTALSKDWASYRLVRRFMFIVAGGLTALHVLVAFTPLYDVVVAGMLGAPADILEPARLGLQILTPWTLSIAYRRFLQGVLIRFGRSWAVGLGTAVRLAANLLVLAVGYVVGTWPGIVVGTLAVAVGVMSEAVAARINVRGILRRELRDAVPAVEPLTLRGFIRFYAPLAVTPLIAFLAMPMASAAMSRMPRPIESLAVWPVINGLVFTLRSLGFAMNEVVVALLERPRAAAALRRFTWWLAAGTSALLLLTAASPLGSVWYGRISALPPHLVALGSAALWLAILFPALSAYQSWYQGAIVHSRRTRGVTESVAIYLAVSALLLLAGIVVGRFDGLHVAMFAMVAGTAAQVWWLWLRARGTFREIEAREV
jgi:hypothetical protein